MLGDQQAPGAQIVVHLVLKDDCRHAQVQRLRFGLRFLHSRL